MRTLPPGSTIGILGGGQLGRMTALAAARLGYQTHIYAPDKDAPACHVTPLVTYGAFDDAAQLAAFAQACDVVTLEWENVPVTALDAIAKITPVHPGSNVLAVTQDRLREKAFAHQHGIAVPPFRAVHSLPDLQQAVTDLGLPLVLKTARMGYDGKGQVVLRDAAQAEAAWQALNSPAVIAETFVTFEREVSVIVARGLDGAMATYPVAENRHQNGILIETVLPATLPPALEKRAAKIARTLAEKLALVGLLAVELFVAGDELLFNEMAPRPHNSGHWSMDFSATSQFEQLVRAVCGLPLGATTLTQPCGMTNLLGADAAAWQTLLQKPGHRLHLYGKGTPRAGRKMGHVNWPQ